MIQICIDLYLLGALIQAVLIWVLLIVSTKPLAIEFKANPIAGFITLMVCCLASWVAVGLTLRVHHSEFMSRQGSK